MWANIRDDECPSEAVRRLVAEREECPTEKLGSLTAAVDVAAVDDHEDLPTEFRYCGYHLTVTADERIVIEP